MKRRYSQLTLEQRYKIEALLKAGHTQTFIATQTGVDKSTVSREIKRNSPQRGIGSGQYVAGNAQAKAGLRHRAKAKKIHFTPALKLQMLRWLSRKRYSPELISARWRKMGVCGVSHEAIYQYIWLCKHSNKAQHHAFKHCYRFLKHGRRRRKRGNYKDTRGIIHGRVFINKRPAVVEQRKRLGDIEADLIMGARHQSALLITVDRASLLTTIDRITSKHPGKISEKIIRRLKPGRPVKTMTFDNDQAFSQHLRIAQELNIKTYFTRPYTSQDKGTVENRNGIIRMFFPKKTDFNTIPYHEIKRVEREINNRPVRKFNYLSANEVFSLRR